MRLTTLLVLLIVAFAACVDLSGAQSAPVGGQGRNLRAEQAGLAGKADDIAGNFIQTLRKNAMLTKATKLEEAGKTVKAGIWRDWAGAISRLNKPQKEKLSMMVAEVAKKDPKKWSTLKKVLVTVFGATVAAGLIYGAQKYFSA